MADNNVENTIGSDAKPPRRRRAVKVAAARRNRLVKAAPTPEYPITYWTSPGGHDYPTQDTWLGEQYDHWPVLMDKAYWTMGYKNEIQNCPVWHRLRDVLGLTIEEAEERGLVVFRTMAVVPMPDKTHACGFIRKRFLLSKNAVKMFDKGAPSEPETIWMEGIRRSETKVRQRKYQATHQDKKRRKAVVKTGPREDARRDYTREFMTHLATV